MIKNKLEKEINDSKDLGEIYINQNLDDDLIQPDFMPGNITKKTIDSIFEDLKNNYDVDLHSFHNAESKTKSEVILNSEDIVSSKLLTLNSSE